MWVQSPCKVFITVKVQHSKLMQGIQSLRQSTIEFVLLMSSTCRLRNANSSSGSVPFKPLPCNSRWRKFESADMRAGIVPFVPE